MRTKKKIADSATISALVAAVTVIGPQGPSGRLSDEEKELLRTSEDVLKRVGKASVDAAKALYTIDAQRLYRGHSNSMYRYGARWGYSAPYTSRLVRSGGIFFQLEPLWQKEGLPEPSSEWQLRPLACLDTDVERWAVWREAVKRSQGNEPTAAMVADCVAAVSGKTVRLLARELLRLDLGRIKGLGSALKKEAVRLGITPEQLGLVALVQYFEHPASPDSVNGLLSADRFNTSGGKG
jgi:hypothetical protein